jgi:hypothetical protein
MKTILIYIFSNFGITLALFLLIIRLFSEFFKLKNN